MIKSLAVAAIVLFASAAPAFAQDFGVAWAERILNQIQAERGPVKPTPVALDLAGGVAYYYDSNVFLEEDDEESDSIIIPFAGARFDYSELRFEMHADLLVNGKFYNDTEDADDDEERFYLHLRQADVRYSFDLRQILRRESEPLETTVLLERVERLVSNTIPSISFDINPSWAIEAAANIQLVRFDDEPFETTSDNNAAFTDATLVWRSPWGVHLMGQGGYYTIDYIEDQSEGGSPDTFGYYVAGGLRGDLLPRLFGSILVGYTSAESDFFIGTDTDADDETGYANVQLRYEATEMFRVLAGYNRLFTFGIGGEPYQLVNRTQLTAEFDATPQISFRARFRWDDSSSALGTDREFITVGGSAEYRPIQWLMFEAGASWRSGETEFNGFSSEFDGYVLHVGGALTY